ncbi:MAG TPA: thiamine diphosphokinase [Gaiellaceae bacterium]|nr:thiamine diphosphokinase [Gaiellaceae bacterium]
MSEQVVVVVSGGEAPDPRVAHAVPPGAPVVAADRGVEHALALGLEVAVAVGDFDSASPEAVAVAEESGTRVVRYPQGKDATDLELALDTALGMWPERILVLAGTGGRLDHELAALLLLASPRYAAAQIDAVVGSARIHVIRGERTLAGVPGDLVSLVPLHGPAAGVETDGLAYPLRGETLEPGTTRGVSNVFLRDMARVAVQHGVLLALRPLGSANP